MSSATDTVPPSPEAAPLLLPLDAWHRERDARMVPFAGYHMPLQYAGIIAEHEWTRAHAGLFDVSHMGQVIVSGAGAGAALEQLLPADLAALAPDRIRYSLLLAEDGGILDDLLITRIADDGEEAFGLVVNGATKADDLAHLQANLPPDLKVTMAEDRALLALQGPEAAAVLEQLLPGIDAEIVFMQRAVRAWQDATLEVSRSGYTGEDGFEISLPAAIAADFAHRLLEDERVRPIGLGARDSLRLEAGLPLYGHDLTPEIDPVTAGLAFAISKRRRTEGGFAGAARILDLLAGGSARRRVGLALEGRLPAREGAPVLAGEEAVGTVTSGGFSPSLGHPIALAIVDRAQAEPGTELTVDVRGRRLPARIVPLPFVPHRYRHTGARG